MAEKLVKLSEALRGGDTCKGTLVQMQVRRHLIEMSKVLVEMVNDHWTLEQTQKSSFRHKALGLNKRKTLVVKHTLNTRDNIFEMVKPGNKSNMENHTKILENNGINLDINRELSVRSN